MMRKDCDFAVSIVLRVVFIMLFAFVAVMFIRAGRESHLRISASEGAQADARYAASYISDLVRQNDVLGRVEVMRLERTGLDSLVIRHRTAIDNLDRWIYFEDGKLLELSVEPGAQPAASGKFIAYLRSFHIEYDELNSTITLHIEYEYERGTRHLTTVIGMRSDRSDGIIIL